MAFNVKNFSLGDTVLVETKTDTYEGVFLPSEDESTIIIKLSSGYNVGIKVGNIVKAKVVEKAEKTKKLAAKKIKQDSSLPKVVILNTGGTIASRVDYKTGGVTADFTPDEMLAMFPELTQQAQVTFKMVRQMMSENLRYVHFNILAKEIEKEVKAGVDAVIVTQGTDFLHYTAAALSFLLEDLPIPVLIVGAQKSSDRGSSDALTNLLSAVTYVVNSDMAEVAVCMHENPNDDTCIVIPGTKVRKMHTSRRDAFRPINTLPFARVYPMEAKVEVLKNDYITKDKKRKLTLRLFNEKLKVGLLKAHVNMFAEEFLAFASFDGLVIEGTGIGQLPNSVVDEFTKESGKIIEAVRTLSHKMPVVLAPQTIYGRVDMNVYSEGRINLAAGVLGNYSDMTPETTLIKLAWLLSQYAKEEIPALISKNFRGEISERIIDGAFLN